MFAPARILPETPKQAGSRAEVRSLLDRTSGGIIFTTIQKFAPDERGDVHPLLTDRRNVVVIADTLGNAGKLFGKVEFAYEHLPPLMREVFALANKTKGSGLSIAHPDEHGTPQPSSVRIVDAPSRRLQNAAKSCRPTRRGATALMRTPNGAHSTASDDVRFNKPAFAAP